MDAFIQGFPVFLLIFCRITSFFVVAPVFASRTVPARIKIGLGGFVSYLVYLTYGTGQQAVPNAVYVLTVLQEILVGLLLGFIVYLFFTLVQTAGAFIDLQVGFAMANVVDPLTGISAPITGNFKYMVLLLLFLTMNGHLHLLQALMNSYRWMPLDLHLYAFIADGTISEFLIKGFSQSFLLALQIAAPIIVAMFLTDVGLGFLAKTAPQYNVFVIGAPLKILLGVLLLVLLMPSLGVLFGHIFSIVFDFLGELFGDIQGGTP
ncbi:flagellar biosynthetic protein FliR [Paenibacillus pasadenensis]|uniref:Flagellar biosynthetic protein FliR n=1 Tax=Paenibacillus pasadenensis TaxID=217090 RepID=A0A2N5N789_9BACL|nr:MULTISPECIES: flagellar biosynthetic protein FliR [Paenibacillus]PLT46185.1 Flagellar biosynthesis protein FliR [Paenibacillus pasadenensis]QGG56646.1 flagellar type III secretion system protein FliR [Paenibacillus sp. B01]